MLVVNGYDGIRSVEEIPLIHLEIWVVVKGLTMLLRKKAVLKRIGESLQTIEGFNNTALYRMEAKQRV